MAMTTVTLCCWVIIYYKIFAYIIQHDSVINHGNHRGKVFIIRISLSKILGPGGLSDVPEIAQLICYGPRMEGSPGMPAPLLSPSYSIMLTKCLWCPFSTWSQIIDNIVEYLKLLNLRYLKYKLCLWSMQAEYLVIFIPNFSNVVSLIAL